MTTPEPKPALLPPPNEKLIRQAERDESRLCSIILRDKAGLKRADEDGIVPEMFWTENLRAMYRLALDYWKQHRSLMRMDVYESLCAQHEKDPEETTRRMSLYTELWAIMTTTDELPHRREIR